MWQWRRQSLTHTTRCRAHDPIQPLASGTSSTAVSRESSPAKGLLTTTRPAGYPVGPEKGTGGGTGVGSGSGRMDAAGNAFFDCLVCGRSVSRVAWPHWQDAAADTADNVGPIRAAPGLVPRLLGLDAARREPHGRRKGASGYQRPREPVAVPRERERQRCRQCGRWREQAEKWVITSLVATNPLELLNGKSRAQSPTKASLKKKFAHSGSAPPSAGRPPHPPSRLGRPPMGTKAHSASPFSPEKATGTSFREGSAGSVASAGAEIGRKTLPGMNRASVPPSAPPSQGSVATGSGSRAPSEAPLAKASPPPPPPGDESSEGDDDY